MEKLHTTEVNSSVAAVFHLAGINSNSGFEATPVFLRTAEGNWLQPVVCSHSLLSHWLIKASIMRLCRGGAGVSRCLTQAALTQAREAAVPFRRCGRKCDAIFLSCLASLNKMRFKAGGSWCKIEKNKFKKNPHQSDAFHFIFLFDLNTFYKPHYKMHIKYFIRLSLQPYKTKKKTTKNAFKNNNYNNKVNATLDNRNQRKIVFLKFYIKKA